MVACWGGVQYLLCGVLFAKHKIYKKTKKKYWHFTYHVVSGVQLCVVHVGV